MKKEKPLYREIGEELLGGELSSGRSWSDFMLEGARAMLFPGYTIRRAEKMLVTKKMQDSDWELIS